MVKEGRRVEWPKIYAYKNYDEDGGSSGKIPTSMVKEGRRIKRPKIYEYNNPVEVVDPNGKA